MRGSRKFCQRGSNFDNVFLVDERWEDPNTTISRPSSARQRNAIKMAKLTMGIQYLDGVSLACNIECWLGSFVFFLGIWTRNAKKPYIFVIFQGGGGAGSAPCEVFSRRGPFAYAICTKSQCTGVRDRNTSSKNSVDTHGTALNLVCRTINKTSLKWCLTGGPIVAAFITISCTIYSVISYVLYPILLILVPYRIILMTIVGT